MKDLTDEQRLNQFYLMIKELQQYAEISPGNFEEIKYKINEISNQFERFLSSFIDFHQIVDNMPDQLYIADGKGKTLYVNPAYIKSSGIAAEEVVGRYVEEISQDEQFFKNPVIPLVIKERKIINTVAHIIRSNKSVFLTGIPVFDNETGEIKYAMSNDHDSAYLEKLKTQLILLKEENEKDNAEINYLRKKQTENKHIRYGSNKMHEIILQTRNIAAADVTVLITGESGTGKELIADEIYRNSKRKDKPFIKVNCAAIPTELLESELFGYEEGSFSGAKKNGKIGMFELANNGTILLDEIGDMPLPMQSKLLRVLQQRELIRVGGQRIIKLNIRVIASTNTQLLEKIKEGRFREDLFYRLNVVPIELPPLRSRPEDIDELVDEFLSRYNKKYYKNVYFDIGVMQILKSYQWPGNVRELENLIERLVVITENELITSQSVRNILNIIDRKDSSISVNQTSYNLKDAIDDLERSYILNAIKEYGSKRKAAVALGISHSTLVVKCQKLNLNQYIN